MPLNVKWPFPELGCVSRSWTLKSRVIIASVGSLSKIWAGMSEKCVIQN